MKAGSGHSRQSSATETGKGVTVHNAATKRKRAPGEAGPSDRGGRTVRNTGLEKRVTVEAENVAGVKTEGSLVSEKEGYGVGGSCSTSEGMGVGAAEIGNTLDAASEPVDEIRQGVKEETVEESDDDEARPAAPASLESFRFKGTAKRRKAAGKGAIHTAARGNIKAGRGKGEIPPDGSAEKLEEAQTEPQDAPTTSGSSNSAVETAVGCKGSTPEDELRLFRQYLKQRLPPPVRPFGNEGGTFFVGTSGWDYKHWKGPVYPEKLSKQDWFTHYCSLFNTVEINNTFYRLPAEPVFETWARQALEGFLYALKFSRFGSHMKKLSDPQRTVGMFVERASHLGGPLQGPVLVQLPPRFRANATRLDEFLQEVPPGARWTVEMRDPSWLCEDIYTVLRRHDIALCIHDHQDIGKGPHPTVLTADWTYLRYHGPKGDYHGGYEKEYLVQQADWIRGLLAEGKDVYAYFNNDMQGHACFDAQELRSLVQEGRSM